MPHDLASDPSKTVFDYDAIISPPKDWERWHDLVRDLTAHLVERYGDEVVEHWSFEVWNEANLEVFWSGTPGGVPQAVRRHRGRRARRRLPAGRRRTVLRRGRLGRGAARARRRGRARRSTSSPPTPTARRRWTSGRCSSATAAPGTPIWWTEWGVTPDPLQRGQRRGLLRHVPGARHALGDGPDRVAVLLGRLRPLRGARPAAGAAARRLRAAHRRRAAQAAVVGAGHAGAARVAPARGVLDGDGGGSLVEAVAATAPTTATHSVLLWNLTLDQTKAAGSAGPGRDRCAVEVRGLTPGATYTLRARAGRRGPLERRVGVGAGCARTARTGRPTSSGRRCARPTGSSSSSRSES